MDSATPALNRPAPGAMDLLLSRRSGSAKAMTGLGPSPAQLYTILTAAARACPTTASCFPGALSCSRARPGGGWAISWPSACSRPSRSRRRSGWTSRASSLPARPGCDWRSSAGCETIPIPEWEQILSAGAVCQTLLIAAHALGFVANWLTEWCAYHPRVKERLGLKPGERIAGFVYIGTSAVALEERVRPDLAKIVARF